MDKSLRTDPVWYSERGFTLIELLVSLAIISSLSGLALTGFIVYRDNAEYTRGEATFRNARVAMETGDMDAPVGLNVGYTVSGDSGGPVPGALQTILPGAETPKDLKLGAMYTYCDDSSNPMQLHELLVVVPCKSTRGLRWVKFCGGTEILFENNPGSC